MGENNGKPMLPATHSSIKRFFIFIWAIILLSNCSKEKGECWDVYTSNGSATKTVCGQTEELIRNVYGKYYDKANAAKFCWKVNYPSFYYYIENMSEKIVGMLYPDAVSREKVTCGYCQIWECYTKRIYKPTGIGYGITQPYLQYPCGDTCATLYPLREVFLYETVDSVWRVVWYKKLH